jgi:hypothetical protein
MNPEWMTTTVRKWMKRTDATAPDAHQSARQVMARLPQVRQRSRWWPLPNIRRAAKPSSSDQSNDYQPTSIPATNGHSPTVLGRTQSMFSPVKAITAGALIFAIGSAFAIAQPFGQQPTVPGAETEAIAPAWVTGDIRAANVPCTADPVVMEGDVSRGRNIECNPQTWTSSDPRLTGQVSRRWSEDTFPTDEGPISVSMGAAYLRNDGGGWVCSDTSLLKGSGKSSESVTETTFICIGDGGYEGLSALLVSEFTLGFSEEFVGLIFSGDFPPLPEAPAAE